MQLVGRRLDGKRLGILGMGQIGQAIAKRTRAFDMEIHYCNRRRCNVEHEQGAIYHGMLDSLLCVSDVLSINAPSTPKTRGCINAVVLAKLPRGAIVVNTARGDLINDDDLIAALKSGKVGSAYGHLRDQGAQSSRVSKDTSRQCFPFSASLISAASKSLPLLSQTILPSPG